MRIKSISWKNFMSYGNNWHTIDFEGKSSLNLLSGKNGAGKTTAKCVIEYGLYGSVINKNLADLLNRINQNMEVKIELEASGRNIAIHRGESPKVFKVDVEGLSNFGDAANKKAVQSSLEELYGIPSNIFNNIVSLSINDFKSFIKMKPEDKRKIIDKIFGLTIINNMRELAKNDLKEAKKIDNNLKVKANTLLEQIADIDEQLENLKEEIEVDTKIQKEEIEEKIGKYKDLLTKVTEKEYTVIEISDKLKAELRKVEKGNSNVAKVMYSLKEKLKLFNDDKCPTCGSDLTTGDFINLKEEYLKEQSLYKTKSKQYENLITEKEEDIALYDKALMTISEKRQNYNMELRQLNNEIKNIKEVVTTDKTAPMVEMRKKTEQTLLSCREETSKAGEELNFLETLDSVLSENGIKKLAMQTILNPINTQLKYLTDSLGIAYQIRFNENFDSHIYHLGKEISVATLSTGETKKLDAAVLIAIIKLMKLKFPGLNLLFLDEVFSSLDTEAIHSMLNILKGMTTELNLHIFVVHHSVLDPNKFDRIFQVEKDNSFSNITIKNLNI